LFWQQLQKRTFIVDIIDNIFDHHINASSWGDFQIFAMLQGLICGLPQSAREYGCRIDNHRFGSRYRYPAQELFSAYQ